jgi:hypothetical protein
MKRASSSAKKSYCSEARHHHAAALAADLERHAELRLDLERLLDAGKLGFVLVEAAAEERPAGLENMDHAPAVRDLQHIEAELALQHGERLRAGADGDQAVATAVVKERVHLVGAGHGGHHVGDVGEGGLEVARRKAQQLLEDVEAPLRKGRAGIRVHPTPWASAVPRKFFSFQASKERRKRACSKKQKRVY